MLPLSPSFSFVLLSFLNSVCNVETRQHSGLQTVRDDDSHRLDVVPDIRRGVTLVKLFFCVTDATGKYAVAYFSLQTFAA